MEDEQPKEENNAKPLYGAFLLPNGARYEGNYVLKPEKEADLSGTPASSTPEPEEVKTIQFRQGQGIYRLDGNVYEGEWVLDKMHGHGLFKFMGGDSYDGDWANSKFHGQGRYQWKSGAFYIGSWEENKTVYGESAVLVACLEAIPHIGAFLRNADVSSGRMHGEGTFTDTEGRQWKGRFFNGQGPGLHTLETKTS